MLVYFRGKVVENIVDTQRYEIQDQNKLIGKDLFNVFLKSKKELCKTVVRGYQTMTMLSQPLYVHLGKVKISPNQCNILEKLFHIFIHLSELHTIAN